MEKYDPQAVKPKFPRSRMAPLPFHQAALALLHAPRLGALLAERLEPAQWIDVWCRSRCHDGNSKAG